MADDTGTPIEREKGWLAILLAWVAGIVDAIGYLTLSKIFTAHMSGNSVAFGAYLGEAHWAEAMRRLTPIPLFVCGIIVGAVVIEGAARSGVRSSFALAMLLEALLLSGYWAYGSTLVHGTTIHTHAQWQFDVLVGLLAIAMGLQNAALQRVSGRTVRTTYVTGMLTGFSTEAAAYLFWLADGKQANAAIVGGVVPRQPSLGRAALLAGIYGAYLVGAVIGGVTLVRWDLTAVALPVAVVVGMVGLDLLRPIYTPASSQ